MKVIAIASVGKQNQIGLSGELVNRSSEDLKKFKELTTNNIIIMGRKTYEEIGQGLPNRINIIITGNINNELHEANCHYVTNIKSAIFLAETFNEGLVKELVCYIIGGGRVYKDALQYCDTLLINRNDYNGEADTYFPEIKKNEFTKIPSEDKHFDRYKKYEKPKHKLNSMFYFFNYLVDYYHTIKGQRFRLAIANAVKHSKYMNNMMQRMFKDRSLTLFSKNVMVDFNEIFDYNQNQIIVVRNQQEKDLLIKENNFEKYRNKIFTNRQLIDSHVSGQRLEFITIHNYENNGAILIYLMLYKRVETSLVCIGNQL